MSSAAKSCAKCGGRMEQGFTLDQDQGQRRVAEWVSGMPIKSFWLGVVLKGRERRKIETWRCQRCAYLESYAPGS